MGRWRVTDLAHLAKGVGDFIENEPGELIYDTSRKQISHGTQETGVSEKKTASRHFSVEIDPDAKVDIAILRRILKFADELKSRNIFVEIFPSSDAQAGLLASIIEAEHSTKKILPIPSTSLLGNLGRQGLVLSSEIASIMTFVFGVISELLRLVSVPKRFRFKEIVSQLDHTGLFAVPICALVTFLIGVVVTYLMGNQLQTYGASIFVVDGVSIAMCRELSPILIAIIVAGRSGSAFAAQLGSMRLNQEVEALQVMGLSRYAVLILPRIIALMLVMPILVVVGDIFGILGGMFIAKIQLDVSPQNFFERLSMVLLPRHFYVGLFKAPLFALFIASIGCRLGLRAEANSVSIGINTTKTVVQSIVSVILLNAMIAVILTNLGI